MAAAVFFPADGRRSSHFDATFRSSTRRSTEASEMVAEPTGKASLPCRISRETTRSSSPSVKGSAATKRRSSFHAGPPPFPRAAAGVVRVLSAWNPSVARTATPASRGGAADTLDRDVAAAAPVAVVDVAGESAFHASAKASSAWVPAHVATMRSAPARRRPPSSLYHCVARGPSGGSRACTSAVSKQRPPRKWRSSATDTSASGGRSHTEISRVGPGESVSVSRTNAKVWSHSKKAPRRASRVDAWRPPAATRTCGCAPAGSPRARTTRTNRYAILSTRSCLLLSIAGVSSGTGGGGRRTGMDTCRGITGGGGCSVSGGFSSDAASSGGFSSGAGVAAAAGSASSVGFSVVDPSPAGAGAVSSTVSSGFGGSSAGAASLLGASLASGGGGASASAAAAGGSGSGGGGGGGRGTSR
nr:unnamed protein product [Digitaria exilis]